MKKASIVLLFLCLTTGLGSAKAATASFKGSRNLKTLVEWFSGSFSSKAHSKRDTNFAHLEMTLTEIWSNRVTDGVWIYQEVRDGKFPDKILSQRFYKFSDLDEKQIEMQVYTLSNAVDFQEELKKKEPFKDVKPDDLTLAEECAIIFVRRTETKYQGNTVGKECKTAHRRATYIMNDVQVFENKIVWAETGHDGDDKIIWGHSNGGHQYMRVEKK
jgi:hypothetical protein